MTTPPYKVAYMKAGEASRLYSRFFDNETEARQYASKVRSEGYEALLMKSVSNNEDGSHYYEWQLLKTADSWKYRLGTRIASPNFMIPLAIGLGAFLFLRKNNGLPRVIG